MAHALGGNIQKGQSLRSAAAQAAAQAHQDVGRNNQRGLVEQQDASALQRYARQQQGFGAAAIEEFFAQVDCHCRGQRPGQHQRAGLGGVIAQAAHIKDGDQTGADKHPGYAQVDEHRHAQHRTGNLFENAAQVQRWAHAGGRVGFYPQQGQQQGHQGQWQVGVENPAP